MTGNFHPAYFQTRFFTDAAVADWPDAFVIISAYATTGETWTDEQNREADASLAQELREQHEWMVRITGYAPDGSHAEPSWATDMPVHQALALGVRYRQDAIYGVKGDHLTVIRCNRPNDTAPVGPFRKRVHVRRTT